ARCVAGSACRVRGCRDPDGDGAQGVDRYPGGGGVKTGPHTIIRTYFAITGLLNLAMSLIWGIDTLFKMHAGLDIQQVLLTNAAFTLGSMVFEIPTGVIADTVGRRVSLLLCLVTLFITTLLYVTIAWRGWGFWAFAWVSVFLGLGYTFYTGAVDAWLVDALKATGYTGPLERVFARGQMFFGGGMLLGTIGGGLLGQIRLDIPYLVWVDGVISSLVGLSLIAGNVLVAPLSRVVRTRTGLLMVSVGAQVVLIVLCGLLTNFFVVVSLYLLYGAAIGLAMPVKQAYLNAHIPSAQRATIISLDSMFASTGGVIGQSVWGA